MRVIHSGVSLFRYSHRKIFLGNRTFQSSSDSYASYIEICGRDRLLESGKILHGYLITTGLLSNYILSKLISFYTQCGKMSDARKVFDEIPRSNLRRWVVLVGAYSRQGFYQEILNIFGEMRREGVRLNQYIIPSILKACGNLSNIQNGERLHCVVLRSALFDPDNFINCSLIDMYSKCGRLDTARNVFERMLEKDLVAWNSIVSGYCQYGFAGEAFNLVEKMKIMRVKPNLLTWNALLAGFSKVGDSEMALKLLEKMKIDGFEPDTVSWTSVISGFVQNFHTSEAFETFKQMMDSGVRPSSFTISSILPACASMADSKRGKEIHGYSLVIGVGDDVFVSSSLVDMYAKCGFIYEAIKIFNDMDRKNTVTWNSMIFGYANHGYCNEAIELFDQMLMNKKVKPNHLTFTAALTACSHAGMIEFGQSLFHLMQEEYRIEPRLEHYASMVDILGRAGRIIEAYDFIKAMPVDPDLFVWGALLGACRNHGNIELAEIAAKNLQELEPENAGTCLLMSSLYAGAGSWADAERSKKLMKKRKLRKNPGFSWIQSL